MAYRSSHKKQVSSPLRIGKHLVERYDHKKIEHAWKYLWEKVSLDSVDIIHGNNPFYNLMMFPYPSAEGLHIGNMYAFTGSDIYGRFKRMQGYDVFEPIGLDGFGIHSENFAFKEGKHPARQAQISEKKFYGQLREIGAMFDWSRTVETYKPEYYKWTQWLFVQLFKYGLAYRSKAEVNWCPSCKTVLADEQVVSERCERCGNKVENKLLEQWFFRITAYAEKLLENLPSLDWSQKVKVAQEKWIGKKQGINITYPVIDSNTKKLSEVTCFTTRPDTNFGATFVVLAPEHSLIREIIPFLSKSKQEEINVYIAQSKQKSSSERIIEAREKTGVFTGLYCLNQLNNYKMPLYISDFILLTYGTGAVVGVPGHDKRDFEFAKEFNIPIIRVVVGKDKDFSIISKIEQVQEKEGAMINSGFLNGLDIHTATVKIADYLEKMGWGKRVTAYHLRDWLISRQRYWGAPIPMIYCQNCAKESKSWFSHTDCWYWQQNKNSAKKYIARTDAPNNNKNNRFPAWNPSGWYPVPDKDLPVLLPYIKEYKPSGDGIAPLAKYKNFYETTCPGCGKKAVRETDVIDTFPDSSWYFLRYPSVGLPNAQSVPFDKDITEKWLPVDMYTGGAEHSVLHLMYSRFMTMALHDMGFLDFDEPFTKFFAHGLIVKDGAKMSKSKGNIVNPDEYISSYGTDALRMYLMFMGPLEDGGDFNDAAMEGMYRYVKRIWKIALASIQNPQSKNSAQEVLHRALHTLIQKVSRDIEKRKYNTVIASFMEFTNLIQDHGGIISRDDLKTFLLLLSPFAPYLAEELCQRSRSSHLGSFKKEDSVHLQAWPVYNPELGHKETVDIIVQVNGKLRGTVALPVKEASDETKVRAYALSNDRVKKHILNQHIKRVIFVPNRCINFVI